MAEKLNKKAPFNDWWYWSECLVKRFRTIEELYKENGEPDRARQIGEIAQKLKDTCMVPVEAIRKGHKTDEEKAAISVLEEKAIFICAEMFRDILHNFPFISSTVQNFIGVKWDELTWDENTNELDEFGTVVKKKKRSGDTRFIELFWGPKARNDEGIRSGRVQDGGLPGILFNLMLAEKSTSNRAPTQFGQFMQSAANQQFINVNKAEKAGVVMNFKPPGGF
ncbi:MAG: hypothetical protein EB059_05365 [Alphaproteobacteria bacterium]|nr:hypothetical protein [Alphaproteobacteria bacterium]